MFRNIGTTLSRLLRHSGCRDATRQAMPCDTGGWFVIRHLLALPRAVWGHDVSLSVLLSVIRANVKNRFQVAIQRVPWEAVDVYGSAARGAAWGPGSTSTARGAGPSGYLEPDALSDRWEHYAVRACSGRSYKFLNIHRLAAPVGIECADIVPALMRVTSMRILRLSGSVVSCRVAETSQSAPKPMWRRSCRATRDSLLGCLLYTSDAADE